MDQNESAVKNKHELLQEYVGDPVKLAYGLQGTSVDYHLQALVRMVDNATNEFSFGITVFTTAGILTGNLISKKKYFEKFGLAFQSGFEAVFPDHDWQKIADDYAAMGTQGDDIPESEDFVVPSQFIHLDGAKLIAGDGSLTLKSGILWRGKLQSVTGFTLGLAS